jgi:hypothetical protein
MKKLGHTLTILLCKLSDFQAGCVFTAVAVVIFVLGIL